MAALLPAGFGLLVFLLACPRTEAGAAGGRRRAFLRAAVATGVATVLLTEAASALGRLTGPTLALGWGLACAGAALALARRGLPRVAPPRLGSARLEVAALAGLAAVVGLVALAAPPNTWDALTYHMARVAHWAQDRRVSVYPTANLRQIELSPFAEFAIAHLYLLSGGDRLSNLVQWGAMVGSWLTVSRIALQLGAGARGQAFAALFVATLPMGILQGASAQNDHVASFWLVCFASLAVDGARGGLGWRNLLPAAGALGLGVLTKGTVAVYAPALLVGLLIARWRDGFGLVRPALVGLAVVVALNLGHALRNVELGSSPLGPSGYAAEAIGPRVLVSGVLRNLALHAAAPWERWNTGVERAVRAAHAAMGADADDPRTTWPGTRFAVGEAVPGEIAPGPVSAARVVRHEDHAPGPLHALLILVAAPLAFLHPRLRGDRALQAAVAIGLVAFVSFCVVLRWQPWHARLHLPAFALAAPWVAVVVARLGGRGALRGLGVGLVLASLPWLLVGLPRPLVGAGSVLSTPRAEQYLASRAHYANGYLGAARILREGHCRHLGLVLSGDSAEYPVWALLGGPASGFRIEHALSEGPTEAEAPCALFSTDPPRESLARRGVRYEAAWRSERVAVLRPAASRPAP